MFFFLLLFICLLLWAPFEFEDSFLFQLWVIYLHLSSLWYFFCFLVKLSTVDKNLLFFFSCFSQVFHLFVFPVSFGDLWFVNLFYWFLFESFTFNFQENFKIVLLFHNLLLYEYKTLNLSEDTKFLFLFFNLFLKLSLYLRRSVLFCLSGSFFPGLSFSCYLPLPPLPPPHPPKSEL